MGCFIFWFSNIADRNIRDQFEAASVQFHIVSAMHVGFWTFSRLSLFLLFMVRWEMREAHGLICAGWGACKQNRQEISPLDNFLSLFFYLFFYGMVQMSLGRKESKRNKYISRKNNPRFKHKSLIFWRFENKHKNRIMHRSHSLYVNTSNINFICITLTMMYRWYCYRNCLA